MGALAGQFSSKGELISISGSDYDAFTCSWYAPLGETYGAERAVIKALASLAAKVSV